MKIAFFAEKVTSRLNDSTVTAGNFADPVFTLHVLFLHVLAVPTVGAELFARESDGSNQFVETLETE